MIWSQKGGAPQGELKSIMKVFKKIAATAMASLAACACIAFTACDGSADPDEVIDGLEGFEPAALSLALTAETKQGTDDAGTITADGKINPDGNGDLSYNAVGAGENEGDDMYASLLMRNYNVYTATSESEEINPLTANYSLLGNFSALPELPFGGYAVADNSYGAVGEMPEETISSATAYLGYALTHIFELLPKINAAVIKYASITDALTTGKNSMTVDVNASLYKTLQDLTSVVNGITETTTVGDLLENSTVKKYGDLLSVLTDVSTVQAALASMQITVEPDENDSVYDYLLKVLQSDAFGTVGSMDEIPISALLASAEIDIATLKTAFGLAANYVTESAINIPVAETAGLRYTDIKIEYQLDGNQILSQVISCAYYLYESQTEIDITSDELGDPAMSFSLSLNIAYADSAFTLAAVDNLPTV